MAKKKTSRKHATADKQTASPKDALPAGLSQPALRALARAGYTSLDQLATIKDPDLLKLHGLGPKGIATLRGGATAETLSAHALIAPPIQPYTGGSWSGPWGLMILHGGRDLGLGCKDSRRASGPRTPFDFGEICHDDG